ncbi:MFS transporter [Streptomyces sp. NPDC026672]|uniref:MFS transporter n=1 Tax=unclassified Streptomyces TaxID=2593676 RepID=UPI0033EF1270
MTRTDDVAAGEPVAADDEAEPSPLRDRRFVVFAVGNVANNLGEALYAVALPLYAYHRTGSLGVMALLAAAVPAATLLAPLFGMVADRRGTRELVLYGLLLQAAAATAMNLLLLQGTSLVPLMAGALLVAVGGVAYRTGWITGVPSMFPASPARARGTLNSSFIATTMAGPMLAAALLPWTGYAGLLWLNLPTFFAPLVVWAVGVHPPALARATGAGRPSRQWRPAFRAIFTDRRVLAMLVVQLVVEIACGNGLTSLILYDLSHAWRLNGEQAGLAIAVMNLSGLLGNLFVSQRRRFRAWRWLTAGLVLRAATLALLATDMWPLYVAALFVGQFGDGMVTAVVTMGRVKYLPAAVLGRASGLLWLLTGTAGLLSSTTVLLVDGALGTRAAFLVLGLSSATVLWYLVRSRSAWTSPGLSPRSGMGETP